MDWWCRTHIPIYSYPCLPKLNTCKNLFKYSVIFVLHHWYQQRIDVTEDDSLKKILEHNRDEEKEHVFMLLEGILQNDEVFAKDLKANLFRERK